MHDPIECISCAIESLLIIEIQGKGIKKYSNTQEIIIKFNN